MVVATNEPSLAAAINEDLSAFSLSSTRSSHAVTCYLPPFYYPIHINSNLPSKNGDDRGTPDPIHVFVNHPQEPLLGSRLVFLFQAQFLLGERICQGTLTLKHFNICYRKIVR